MKTLIKQISLFALLLYFIIGCSDILDQNPQDRYSDAVVWEDMELIDQYVSRIYRNVYHGLSKSNVMGSMTDELADSRGGVIRPWNEGAMSPDNFGPDRGEQNWDRGYSQIHRINLALDKISAYEGSGDIDRVRGELLFLRAWTYHQMIRSYGGLVLIESPFELDDDFQGKARSTFEETVSFIVQDADAASELLGYKTEMQMGRATKEAAMALKSRVLLFAASELTAGSGVENEIVGYINPDRNALWTAARDAAQDVINLGTMSLADFGAPDQEAVSENYFAFFETTDLSNDEIIWGRMFRQDTDGSNDTDLIRQNLRFGPNGLHNWGGNGPLQQLVDSYQMSDGSDFFDHFSLSSNDEYINTSSTFTSDNPYHDRDPRFHATVLYDSTRWQPRFSNLEHLDPVGIYDRRTRRTIENGQVVSERFGLDTNQGPVEDWNATNVGYLLKKFMQRDIIGRDEFNNNSWIHLRYAEVLMNYAEASLELGDEATAATYINMVRNRAGMPDLNGDVREALKYERKIEFVGENIRWHDIRRWKIVEDVLPETPLGITITEVIEDGETTITWRQVRAAPDNNFVERLYWIPIDSEELSRAPQIQQNPGY
ncbi:MAG: RagB/SusD family nutrient uptake outer membrane protein [Balneolaceae bacterium]|nr:RagB/SusD family nutrient uptake outer membrane protein [Balneolaceae bacterium]